ncbi:MAG: carbon starvation CstA family protein, partial [Planctomycetota bacterium]
MKKNIDNILIFLTLAGYLFFSNGCTTIDNEKIPSARIVELHQQTIAKHARQIISLEYETKQLADTNRIQQSAMASMEAKIEEQISRFTFIENKQQKLFEELKQLNQSIDKLQAGIEELKKIQPQEQRLEKIEKETALLKTLLSANVQLKDKTLQVTAGEKIQTVVTISPKSVVSSVSFEVEDPAVASVEPVTAKAAQQKITIKGLKQGQTRLIVRLDNHQLTELHINILPAAAAPVKSTKTAEPAATAKPKTERSFNTLILMLVCGVGYLLAYHTYGRFLARKIFKIVKDAPVPSKELEDGIDYVPAKKGIIFGHHYTSIAGTGPIVGPAIGVIWGWLPAILWVVFGAIFMGAVHDFGALIVSLRNEGKSISEIAAKYINKRVRFIFFAIVFLSLLIVIAVFGVVIAAVFSRFPTSVIPVWLQIPIAVTLGYRVYKKSANIILATTVAVGGMYLCIYLGSLIPVKMGSLFGLPSTGLWTIILLIYAWIASTLPVTTLLQPRDYINAWQLFIAMAMLVMGTVMASFSGNLPLVAPAINTSLPENTPPVWPFLFVYIACGAISGFHSLVASGTTAKQIEKETDSHFVGYGSMLLE